MKFLGDQLRAAVFGILWTVALISIIRYFKLSLIGIWLLLTCASIGLSLVFHKFTLKGTIKNTLTILALLLVLRFLGSYGVVGGIIALSLIILYIMITRWQRYLEAKYQIEAMIWGKPLKKYMEENKKPPKVKLRLHSKKQDDANG